MCILFLHTEENPDRGKYKLILAANRDEFYHRPAKPADYWKQNINIVGGQDLEKGREGGTWLAMCKTGKIGILLNIQGESETSFLPRGKLVTNYVTGNETAEVFSTNISADGSKYNGFHLLTIDIELPGINVVHFTNIGTKEEQGPRSIGYGTIGVSNTALRSPLLKLSYGTQLFNEIIHNNNSVASKEILVEKLKTLLKCEKRHLDQDVPSHLTTKNQEGLSAIFVKMPDVSYGTRTHTVILITAEGEVDFQEWTMQEPIIDVENPKWLHQQFQFELSSRG